MAKFYFYYASMNAGKSTVLLQADFNYRERGMATMLWTAALDDRYRPGTIASRIGLEMPAHVFDAATDLRGAIAAQHAATPLNCVLVDEAQFLTRGQVFALAGVADELGIPVLAYGLRTDFQATLFEGSMWLLALADILSEIKAVCGCGRKATMNLRLDAEGRVAREGAQTEIGGNDRYLAVCRRHFMAAMRDGALPDAIRPA
ncbi:thymidine kinase [Sphingomonas nostoxanthinifaciens]|uniref:thymidine kinase n=1 Tax=Sphingomonas nostoxanthinifaciens TaxID=2872652 RepID=UPI001CC1E0E3|nr:thymidine kinase [Sphingomonas nostoxanthinifaciens]UAK25053.1 thymidine kinase [Sphingomonas nostoxanthinifaciens]